MRFGQGGRGQVAAGHGEHTHLGRRCVGGGGRGLELACAGDGHTWGWWHDGEAGSVGAGQDGWLCVGVCEVVGWHFRAGHHCIAGEGWGRGFCLVRAGARTRGGAGDDAADMVVEIASGRGRGQSVCVVSVYAKGVLEQWCRCGHPTANLLHQRFGEIDY